MPFPMKSAANRFGKAGEALVGAGLSPQTGSDSSHGSPTATPTPRSIVRREMRDVTAFMDRVPENSAIVCSSITSRSVRPKGFRVARPPLTDSVPLIIPPPPTEELRTGDDRLD